MSSEAEISPQLKLFVGAICTIVFEFCCGHILEIFKIKRQTTSKSMVEIYNLLTKKKGIAGIWDGFVPWGLLMASCKGAAFSYGQATAYNMLISISLISLNMSSNTILILSSGLGGLFQGIIMSPLLLLKTRVITHDKFRNIEGGVFATIVASFFIGYEIIITEGLFALCKGMRVFSFKRFCDWLTRYLFVEMTVYILESYLNINVKGSTFMITAAGLFGGLLSALSTSILDVMTALTQQHAANNKNNTLSKVTTRGLVLRIWHVALTTVVMKNSVPFMCQLIMKWQGDDVFGKTEI